MKISFSDMFYEIFSEFYDEKRGSINQGSRFQCAGNVQYHIKGENFLINEVLLIFFTNLICLISEVTCNSVLQHKLI